MPVPAIIGFGALGSFLGTAFASSVEFVGKFVTKQVAVKVVLVAGLIALLAAFVGIIEGLIAALTFAFPAEFGGFLPYVLPWNTSLCISTIATAKIARYSYEWNARIVQYTFQFK